MFLGLKNESSSSSDGDTKAHDTTVDLSLKACLWSKITCNDQRISLSNKVKVLKMGTKVTSLQVATCVRVLRYFKNVTRFYSSIVTCYFYSITVQVWICHICHLSYFHF